MALSWRISLISMAIAVTALASLSLVVSSWVTDVMRDASLRRIADNVNRETQILQRSLDILKSDVMVLARLDPVLFLAEAAARTDISTEPLSVARRRLAESFVILMERRPSYAQVRLISAFEAGRELVRVNRDADRIVLVPDPELQRKGDRYYLEETLGAPAGSVYVSRVDLNREHGRIVEPHEPVFRVGTAVRAPDGSVIAAIVVNIFFDAFVGDLVSPAPDLALYVTNESGDFLRHPDPAARFAFEFGRTSRIQDMLALTGDWRDVVGGAPISRMLPEPQVGVVFDRIALDHGAAQKQGKSLIVAAVASTRDLDAQARSFQQRILTGALSIGIALALALGMATHMLTRPIGELTQAATRIAGGEKHVRLDLGRTDEIGELSRALSTMLASLEDAARGVELASMGRMASMVAHDLRNALSSVKMNVQILGRRHVATADPDAAHIRIATEQIQYMESILADMLTFARKDELSLRPVDIGDVLSAAVLSELAAIDSKGIELVLASFAGLPPVMGDRVKLIQVFQNLIANAVQATPREGRIGITGHEFATGTFMIDIADNGEGMTESVRQKAFEPFFTTRTKGTGLGLAIVRRIIKQHDGSVELLAGSAGGTVARVSLPTYTVSPDVPPSGACPSAAYRRA